MTTAPITPAALNASWPAADLTVRRVLGCLMLGQFLIFLIPLIVLGSAINWPSSLGDPARVVLPRIAEQATAVTVGYTGYFVSALLLLPIAVLFGRLFAHDVAGGLVSLGVILGSIASLAKLLGIARWLLVMPTLSTLYLDPAADLTTQQAVLVVYTALNTYIGGVGELLGVALFSGLWTLVASLLILRRPLVPRWLGWFGLVAAACSVAISVELVGIELSSTLLIAQGVVWQLWMISVGVALLMRRSPPLPVPATTE